MPRVCVLLADGFEEIEATTIVDVLRRAEVEVATLGVSGRDVRGAHDIVIRADRTLEEGGGGPWDAVILPGGMPGSKNLRDDPAVQKLIRRQKDGGGKLAAICAAPIALAAAGVLEGVKATSYPGFDREMKGAKYLQDRVVVDGDVTTSRGPGTALEFALELVRQLCGAGTARELEQGMLVRR
ncbi:MAG: DJ-1/PfpI family protein [Planctomycetes bacterium]|nr:DJ-1/PfpI family protein [Planctomycetota bacterium]